MEYLSVLLPKLAGFLILIGLGAGIARAGIVTRESLPAFSAFLVKVVLPCLIVTLLGGGNPLGVVIATVAGAPMYADIFGTIPIAEALLAKGALLGVVLAFMMAVTTLSLPSLVLLRKAVKPRLLALFVGVCAVGIVTAGYLFNALSILFI